MHMITQELIAFIKAQLQEGKSREQIAGILTPHGWALEDINAAFAQVMPTMPAAPAAPTMPVMSPIMQDPEMVVVQPQIIQPQIAATPMGTSQTGSGPLYWFKNPNTAFTGIVMVISLIVSSLTFYYAQVAEPIVALFGAVSQNALLAGLAVTMLVFILLGGVIVQLVTKILGVSNRSFARAFVFTSVSLVLSSLLNLISLAGVSPAVALLPVFVAWGALFAFYYEVGIVKTVLAFIVNWFVVIMAGALVFFSASALGLGSVNNVFRNSANAELPKGVALQQVQAVQPVVQESLQVGQVLPPEGIVTPSAAGISIPDVAAPIANPDYFRVRDAFPAGFPLPADSEVIAAEVLSATNFEGIRYILDYTSTGTPASVRTAIRKSLEAGGYLVSVNETNPDYRVMTASKVTKNLARTFKVTIEKTATGTMVRTVFAQ